MEDGLVNRIKKRIKKMSFYLHVLVFLSECVLHINPSVSSMIRVSVPSFQFDRGVYTGNTKLYSRPHGFVSEFEGQGRYLFPNPTFSFTGFVFFPIH